MQKGKLDLIDQQLLYKLDRGSDTTTLALAEKMNVPRETIAFRIVSASMRGFIE